MKIFAAPSPKIIVAVSLWSCSQVLVRPICLNPNPNPDVGSH